MQHKNQRGTLGRFRIGSLGTMGTGKHKAHSLVLTDGHVLRCLRLLCACLLSPFFGSHHSQLPHCKLNLVFATFTGATFGAKQWVVGINPFLSLVKQAITNRCGLSFQSRSPYFKDQLKISSSGFLRARESYSVVGMAQTEESTHDSTCLVRTFTAWDKNRQHRGA